MRPVAEVQPGDIVAGIDVGGTFTDLVIVDGATGDVRIGKSPTTVDDQSRAVLAVLGGSGYTASQINLIIHAPQIGPAPEF